MNDKHLIGVCRATRELRVALEDLLEIARDACFVAGTDEFVAHGGKMAEAHALFASAIMELRLIEKLATKLDGALAEIDGVLDSPVARPCTCPEQSKEDREQLAEVEALVRDGASYDSAITTVLLRLRDGAAKVTAQAAE